MRRSARKAALVLSAVLALAMAVTGCGGSSNTGGSGTGGGAKKDPILIGQLLPQTGQFSESVLWHKNGAALAAKQINDKGGLLGGRQLQIVTEDDQSSNPGAVAALNKLVGRGDLSAALGTIRSTQVQAIMPVIKDAKIPLFIGGTNEGLTHAGNPWIFRERPHDGYSGKALVAYAVDELKKKNVAIVHSSDAFGTGGRDSVTKELEARGMKPVIAVGYNNGDADYIPQINQIKGTNADVIISYFTGATDLGKFANQRKQLSLDISWVGSPSITNQDALKLASAALVGTYGVTDYNLDATPAGKTFGEAYRKEYNQEPDLYAAWTYDAVTIFGMAVEACKCTDADNLRKAILAIKGHPGAEGKYDFDENGDGLHSYYIVKYDNGMFKYDKTMSFK